jgi:hypothetical protein
MHGIKDNWDTTTMVFFELSGEVGIQHLRQMIDGDPRSVT